MLTVKEAAEALRVSDQTVWRYIKVGQLAGRKVGRQYLIPEDSVEAMREPERAPPEEGGEAHA